MKLLAQVVAGAAVLVALPLTPATAADSFGWQTTTLTATVAGADLGNMTVTNSAETFAAWTQKVGSNFQPQISRGGKTTPITWSLDVATAADSNTRVAMAADGSVGFAVYKKTVGAAVQLWWSRWNGTAWSASSQLAGSLETTTPPSVDIRDDGSFGVVAYRASNDSIFALRFDGTTFEGPDTIATSTQAASLSVAVADDAERSVIAWSNASIQMVSRAWNGTSWGPVRNLSQNPAGPLSPVGEVDMSADGTVTAAIWKTNVGGQWVVRAATGNGDSWNAPTALHSGTYAPSPHGIDIALSADGASAVATWSGQTGGGGGQTAYVYRNSLAAGAWSGSTIVAGPFLDGIKPSPDAALSAHGDRAVLGYQQHSGNGYRARVQVFTAGQWNSPASFGTDNANQASGRTQVDLTSQGTRGASVTVQQTGGQQYLVLNTLTVLTTPDPPEAPSAEYLTYAGTGLVLVRWKQSPFDGNTPILDYGVDSEPSGTYCGQPQIYLTCQVLGMTAGVPYRFRITAYNSKGASVPSEWSQPVTVPLPPTAAPPVPADPAPSGTPVVGGVVVPTVSAITIKVGKRSGERRKVVVRWIASGSPVSYRVRLTKPGAKKWRSWQDVTVARKSVKLSRGKTYRVAVSAGNAQGQSSVLVKRFRVKR